jgi:hypothetical protein
LKPKTLPGRVLTIRNIGLALVLIDLIFWATQGVKGGEGFTFGIVGAAFNLWALWAIIGLGAAAAPYPKSSRLMAVAIVVAFFAKLPVFIGLGLFCIHIGPPSLGCFIIGVALVYSATVGWALARS